MACRWNVNMNTSESNGHHCNPPPPPYSTFSTASTAAPTPFTSPPAAGDQQHQHYFGRTHGDGGGGDIKFYPSVPGAPPPASDIDQRTIHPHPSTGIILQQPG